MDMSLLVYSFHTSTTSALQGWFTNSSHLRQDHSLNYFPLARQTTAQALRESKYKANFKEMAVTKVCFPLSSTFFCLCCLLWLHMKSTPGTDTLLLSHLPVGAILRSWRTQVSEDAPVKIIPSTTSLLFLPASCLWSMGQVALLHVPTARMFCRPVMYQFPKIKSFHLGG